MVLTPLITFKKLQTPLASKKCEAENAPQLGGPCPDREEATTVATTFPDNKLTQYLLCDRHAAWLKRFRFGSLYMREGETQAAYVARLEARDWLLEILKPGDKVSMVLRHRSSSGMYRVIDFFKFYCEDGEVVRRWLSRPIATLLGEKFDEEREALGVSGAGMDMGFHIVYNLGSVLWATGFECADPQPDGYSGKCPSNDHSNAYSIKQSGGTVPTHHRDGGYALRYEWIG